MRSLVPRRGYRTRTCEPATSWNRSRSPEKMATGGAARAARVPMMSSASKPGKPMTGTPQSSSTFHSTGIWRFSRSSAATAGLSGSVRCSL